MCGICGIIDPAGIDPLLLERMTDGLAHRGPDARGTWISPDRRVGFGHRRLTIIDLDPRSNQPFISDDGEMALTFNGEIYNFHDIRRELAAKGHRFRTESDTEVILHAYDEWGFDSVHRLRGMFAFAIYDRRRNRVWIARDRIGIKPVIYYQKDGLLAFSSDIQTLSSAPFDAALDITALYDCLIYQYIPAPKTAFRYVHKLEAGHWMLWENGHLTDQKYWDVPAFGENIVDEATAIKRVRELIDESVRLRLLADVPVGTLLSGGIDSSAVTYYAQKNASGPLHAFSVGFDVASKNELEYAELLARELGSDHVTRMYTSDAARERAAESMFLYGEPHGDMSIFPTAVVSQMARDQVTVALSGDGGDEVFWGYKRYLEYPAYNRRNFPFRKMLRAAAHKSLHPTAHGRIRLLRRCLDDFDLYTLLIGGITRTEIGQLMAPDLFEHFRDYDDYWAYRKFWREDVPLATRLQYLDLKVYLADDILVKVDRASMSVALEARVPLLDHKLIEEVFSWPDAIRSDGHTLKYIFKKAMRGVLPEAILTKPKHGFSPPWNEWIKEWDEVREAHGDGSFFAKNRALPPDYTVLMMQHWLTSRRSQQPALRPPAVPTAAA
ncbi:MAG TPA: asparagine synthase (glutamine-hydrolyzing) [bacterium]|jgi:asparagine synthase (glutamine-hydrolysing)